MKRSAELRYGAWAAGEISVRLGVPITKALDPLDPGDFLTISGRLADSLRGATAGLEGAALDAAIQALDVDWPNLTDGARDRVILAARAEIAGLAKTVPSAVEPLLSRSSIAMVLTTRKSAIARFDLDLEIKRLDELPVDKETAENCVGSQIVYVKDQYGVRADSMDQMAKDIVAGGLERGLGRDDISEELSTKLGKAGVARAENYWQLVATDFANKARTSTQLNTFLDAGISMYRFDAILDEATSSICRLLHGRIFSVKKAATRMRADLGLRDPEEIKNAMPWVSAKDGGLVFERNGREHTVANIDESGEGARDKIGTYSNVMSNKALEAAGVTVPPRHGHCRSTITAVQ